MKKIIMFLSLILSLVFILSSCKNLDVVGNYSLTSFQKVLETIPDNIIEDEVNGGWTLSAPDESAKFFWSKNFSDNQFFDVLIMFDDKPFIDAGLNKKKLPKTTSYYDKITIGTKLGNESLTYNGEATALSSFEYIVNLKRESIKYHSSMDHFSLDLGNGNFFEWAKDVSNNDKDIVFVLDPQIFIDAGADPAKIEGWILTKVETMDSNGKSIEVDKLLKSFDLS